MTESTLYDKFNGYNAYPPGTGEQMVRARLMELFEKIIKKNETCLVKARDMGMEKLMSRILAVRSRMERIKKEFSPVDSGAEYKFEPLSPADESALNEVDRKLENVIRQCVTGIESLTCMETDMHISEKFAMMDGFLRDIERLFHQRMEIIKKMRIYG